MISFFAKDKENKDKAGKNGIVKQIQAPLMIFVLILVVLTAALCTVLILRMSSRAAMRQASNQAAIAAGIMSEYNALPELIDYWVEHKDDLEPVYDDAGIDDMETQFRDQNPYTDALEDVTGEEFKDLPEEDKRLFARLVMGRLSRNFDALKEVFSPKWLFSFAVIDGNMYYLVTGTIADEARFSEGGDIFELGVVTYFDISLYPNLHALVDGTIRYSRDEFYSDMDTELGAAGSWVPIESDGKIIAVVGSSKSYIDILREWIPAVIGLIVLIIVVFIYLEIWIIGLLKKRVINPVIAEETTILDYMDTKDTALTVEKLKSINTGNEIESLAVSFSQMIEEIERYVEHIREITAESERIGAELNVAKQIQEDMLPSVFPPYPGRNEFEIYASMDPAKEVGGDFYDFFLKDEDHLVIVIGDVSGKGVPAALIMAISKNTVRNLASGSDSPAEILTQANKALCDGNEEGMFVTLWIGIVDLTCGHVISGNAGHEHPAIYRAGAGYELDIYDHDMPLGLLPDVAPYGEKEFDLHPGDSIFVYTDGIPEATDPSEEFFGTDRLLEVLNTDPDADPENVISNVKSRIEAFSSGAEQFDDITMLCFKYLGG